VTSASLEYALCLASTATVAHPRRARASIAKISYNGRGLFWVALAVPRIDALEQLAAYPWLRQVLFRLPATLTDVRPPAVAWVLGVDAHGTVRHHLREKGGRYANITSVLESDGVLWLGSLFGRVVGRTRAPAGPSAARVDTY
jgi:hypothetical protein